MQIGPSGTAVVTGGGSGIGRACAHLFASAGMKVAIADLNAEGAASVAEEITRAGGTAVSFACDVSDRSAVRELAFETNRALGAVELLFANAGVTSFKRLIDTSDEEWDWINSVNYDGVSQCIRAFLPDMIKAGRGHIVATGSTAGLIPSLVPSHVPYSAAKAAVIALMVNLRIELLEHGITCSVVCPGKVTTSIIETSRIQSSRYSGPECEPIPTSSTAAMKTRSPEQAAALIAHGIREDQLFIFTDSSNRDPFDAYVEEVRSGFASTARFEEQVELPSAGKWP